MDSGCRHACGEMEYCSDCESPRLPGDSACPWCEKPWAKPSSWKRCSLVYVGDLLPTAALHMTFLDAWILTCALAFSYLLSSPPWCIGKPLRSDPAGHLFDDEWDSHRVCGWKPPGYDTNPCS